MKSRFSSPIAALFILIGLAGCQSAGTKAPEAALVNDSTKIVSLNGTITETLCALGFEKNIIGTDVTSTYPASMQKLPKTGHIREMHAEGVLALNPTIVFASKDEFKPELKQQLEAGGVKVVLIEHAYSVEGAEKLIKSLADTLGVPEKAAPMIEQIHADLKKKETLTPAPKILFIYARGAGSLMVAGQETQMDQMINLAGGVNAMQGFTNFKPLTPESLLEANPDIILMFDHGMSALQGEEGLLALPGVANTKAGKNKAFISMEGQYLAGFGPRLGAAVAELNQKIKALNTAR